MGEGGEDELGKGCLLYLQPFIIFWARSRMENQNGCSSWKPCASCMLTYTIVLTSNAFYLLFNQIKLERVSLLRWKQLPLHKRKNWYRQTGQKIDQQVSAVKSSMKALGQWTSPAILTWFCRTYFDWEVTSKLALETFCCRTLKHWVSQDLFMKTRG